MPDDKSKTGVEDRRTVAADEPYEVAFFAKKHGLTHGQVRELIKKFGNERPLLDVEASKLAEQHASAAS
jgi:hypothetical protein